MSHFLQPLLSGRESRRLVNERTGELVAAILEAAFDSATRRRGLLGREDLDEGRALVLAPCNAIHTCGMRFPIDVLFVARDGLDACVCRDIVPPKEKAQPPSAKPQRQLPGEEFESAKPLPPLNEVVGELPSESEQPVVLNVPAPAPQTQPVTNEAAPPPEPTEDALLPPAGQ